MKNRSFWEGKRVFITGHTGFKGSWLSLWFNMLGAEVVGYSLSPPSDPNLFEVARIYESVSSIIEDVRDLVKLTEAIENSKPDVVIHMAAQSIVKRSYEYPVDTYSTNVMGTVNILEAVRRTSVVKAIVVVTSDKCYENKEWVWGYRETDPVGGYDPYSSSKGCAELVSAAYRRSFFSKTTYPAIATVRAGNVIGGGDWGENRLVPDVIKNFLNKKDPVIRNPDSIRPWQYVLDVLNGYITLAEHLLKYTGKFEGAWNFSPPCEDARKVEWVVEKLAKFWGNGVGWRVVKESSHHEASLLKLDSSKARTFLKWKSLTTLQDCLKHTVMWYKAYQRKSDMHTYSKQEILNYEERKMWN